MTCRHVLGLIDAEPFVSDYPHAHLEAAWQHARQCAMCGPAFRAATALMADLAALPPLPPPADLEAVVFARITRLEPATPVSDAQPLPEARELFEGRDWSAWATALGGAVAGLAVVLSAPLGTTSGGFRGMTVDSAIMFPTTSGGLVLVAGLALYAAGLLASVGGRGRP